MSESIYEVDYEGPGVRPATASSIYSVKIVMHCCIGALFEVHQCINAVDFPSWQSRDVLARYSLSVLAPLPRWSWLRSGSDNRVVGKVMTTGKWVTYWAHRRKMPVR